MAYGRMVLMMLAAGTLYGAEGGAGECLRAIRDNDPGRVRSLCANPNAAGLKDKLGTTPLHYAAIYGSTETLKILLDAGADANARDSRDATPLIYGSWSFDRARLLMEKGADATAHTRDGITALMIASSAHGNAETVKLLVRKGADVNATASEGDTALLRASEKADTEVVRFLLEKKADAKHADKASFSPLANAAAQPSDERFRLLLEAGADVNLANTFAGEVKHGPIALVKMTPLMLAAPHADPAEVELLLKAGAQVNATDARKMSALMLAVATDAAKPATITKLVAAGADVNAKDQNGESVLDWARKFGNPEILGVLQAAGAKGQKIVAAPVRLGGATAGINDAIAKATRLLAKSEDVYFPETGCVGCHHQPLGARAFAAVRDAGLPVENNNLKTALTNGVLAVRPRLLPNLPVLSAGGGDYDSFLSFGAAQAELGNAPDDLSDAFVHYLALRQSPNGAWINQGIARPPLEEGSILRTASAVRLLRCYAWPARQAEFTERIARAKSWLLQATPATNYERADRIRGLRAAGANAADLRKDVDELLREQKEDGGWAQTAYLNSDAYATGMVMRTLYAEGFLKAGDPAYARGVTFLLSTQFPDGSWYVRSRAPKFQPYFQSGFPFDHDQWISSAATAWAVMALAPAAKHETLAAVR